jgi:hypothetical protein
MAVRIVMATIVLLCAIALQFAGKPSQISAAYQQHPNQDGQRGSPDADNSSSTAKQDSAQGEVPHWYALPEWVLVIVGSLTFIVIGWQSYETKRAADAGNKSAQAFVNSERAWVIAELIPMARRFEIVGWQRSVGSMWATMSEEEISRGEHLRHRLRFINLGRTAFEHFSI